MKKFFYWILIAFLLVALAVEDYERRHQEPPTQSEVVDSITTTEVKPDTAPVPRDSVVLRYQYVKIPLTPPPDDGVATPDSSVVRDSITDEVKVEKLGNDSVSISIPITQSRYETEDYRAYVSGYNARLDSIFVTSRQTVVRIRDPAKKKRFSIGIQAGYGMTPKGFQPYLGLGVSVNLFNF